MTPKSRPKAPFEVVLQAAKEKWGEGSLPSVYLVGVRSYYRDSMGVPGVGDVGIYDDAIFLITPRGMRSANGNTDPSRLGWNPGVGKPFAVLQTGVWWFRRGPHKGKIPALRQCTDEEADSLGVPGEGEFLVERSYGQNDPRNYMEKGYFAINMHPGGYGGTSSWGCQTIHPDQANDFLQAVWDESLSAKQSAIPYILISGPIA